MKLMILGTGGMAHKHAEAFQAMEAVEIVACADMNIDAAMEFAAAHDIPAAHDSLDKALDAGGFDAVANVTPDAVHHSTTMALLNAGCHVFCEKPLATRARDAWEMADAASKRGVINGVNLSYRNVSALQQARRMISDGVIGSVRHIEASYLQSWLTQPAWGEWSAEPRWLWRLSTRHGSHGVMGDIGVHILDFASFAVNSPIVSLNCRLKTFDKAPDNRIGEYLLDANDSFSMTVEMANGAGGVIHASRFASGHLNDLSLKVFGTEGGLHITNEGDLGCLRLCTAADLPNGVWREKPLAPVASTFERFAGAVETGQGMQPDFKDAAVLQQVMDDALASDASGTRWTQS